jgi:hypothetical protein
MKKTRIIRVDEEIFFPILSGIKDDFFKQGIKISDREATLVLGLKLRNKRYIL